MGMGASLPEEELLSIDDKRAEHTAGTDLGEVYLAVSYDGGRSHLMNGRLLRSKKQKRNKLIAKMDQKISRTKKGSKRRNKLVRAKKKHLRKVKHQIQDIEHKETSYLVNALYQEGIEKLVIGDVRDIRQELDVGSKNNQKPHQWSFGSVRHKLTYKAEHLGMRTVLQEEKYTSRICPACGHRGARAAQKGASFTCSQCSWTGHRDAVGAFGIRAKYHGEFGSRHVVGAMAPPTPCGYVPHGRVSP